MVNPSDVKSIIPTKMKDEDIEAFILGATELVNATLTGSPTTPLRKEIIRWLTAHMIAGTREQQLVSAGAGSATATFQGVFGLGLDGTMYGQQVKLLDTPGKLAALSGKGNAYIHAIRS